MFAHAAKAIIRSSIGRAIIQIAACGTGIVALCVATTGALTLAAGGTLKQALFAAAISFAQIGAYGYIHGAIEGLKGATLVAVKVGLHAVVGGAVSMVQGGSFGTGALTGAVSAAASLATDNSGYFGHSGDKDPVGIAERTAIAAVAGGTASVLSGGKFANGAITGAFAQLYNGEGGADLINKQFYHKMAIGIVANDMEERGWTILHNEAEDGRVGTRVPGGGIRFYDLIARSPADGLNYGVEVKTTYGDEWALRWSQVFKDVQVAKNGAVTTSGIKVNGVGYAGVTVGAMREAVWSTTVMRQLLLNSGTKTWPQLWVGDGK